MNLLIILLILKFLVQTESCGPNCECACCCAGCCCPCRRKRSISSTALDAGIRNFLEEVLWPFSVHDDVDDDSFFSVNRYGNTTSPNFVVAITDYPNGDPVCSGAVVSSHFVITSCHGCLHVDGKTKPSDSMRIVAGSRSDDVALISYDVDKVITHPGCTDESFHPMHNIGVLKTTKDLTIATNLQPARIPPREALQGNFDHFQLRLTASSKHAPNGFWSVETQNLPSAVCERKLSSYWYDPTSNICTEYQHPEGDEPCQGDLGASLLYDDWLIGILTHTLGCGGSESVAGYVNVPHNHEWLRQTIQHLSGDLEDI